MAHAPIQIVDENDQPLRAGTMEEAQSKGLWHRIVRIVIEDEDGRILLQKRSASVATFPHCWDVSASGHVDAGEDYITAARRETLEEIGLKSSRMEEIENYKSEGKYNGRILNRFNKTYNVQAQSSQHFMPEPEEVDELKWFSRREMTELFQNHPDKITDGLKHVFS